MLPKKFCFSALALFFLAAHPSRAEPQASIQTLRDQCLTRHDFEACKAAMDYYSDHDQRHEVSVVAQEICLQKLDNANCHPYFMSADIKQADHWHWPQVTQKNLVDKIAPAPPDLVAHLVIDNKVAGYSSVPTSTEGSSTFLADLKKAISGIPAPILAAVNPGIVGIFLVNHLGTSAYTASLFDADHNPAASLIVLDPGLFDKKANEWATWKENTPFTASGDLSIHSTFEEHENDTRVNAIEFILLHELGHALGTSAHACPDVSGDLDAQALNRYPFILQSWEWDGSWIASKYRKSLPKIKFYADPGKQVPRAQAVELYRELQKTNFPSLYASTSALDDFAESFATYVHTVLEHKPYRFEIKKDGKPIATLTECWSEPRCTEKRSILESILPKSTATGSKK